MAAGTYVAPAQIVINKDILLQGAGKALTTIVPGFNTTNGSYLVSNALIYVDYGVTSTIEDLAIDGTGYIVRHAIQSRATDLTVKNCDIRNISSHIYHGRGIVFLTGTGLVENCTMSNIQRIGVHIRGHIESNAPFVTVDGLNYTGKGTGDFLDYGIEFGGGGTGTVQNSTITNCLGVASEDGSTSAGILVTDYYGTFTIADIFNSELSGNSAGLHVGYADTDISDVDISGCNISGNTDFGVFTTGVEVIATCNWWGDVSGPTHDTNPGASGDAVSDNVTFLPWLVALDGPCASGTLLGDKYGVRDDLAGLLPSGDKKTDKILEKAIKHLEKSLADELWEDNYHLSSKGIKVFEEEKTAVHELMKISDLDGVSASILALVEADRMLAEIAIDEAVNEKDKAKAEGEMDKALDEFSKDNFDKAVEHYKQAWHHATKALKSLTKSFANSDGVEGSELVDSAIPEVFGLGENYPNPFNPTTLISYDLPEASQVTMTVYDMMGRQVKALVQEFQPAGNHSVIWNATNDNGTRMSGGIYFYQIKAGSFLQTHKMILLK